MLLLDRDDVAALLPLSECIPAVEEAFRRYATGEVPMPAVASVAADRGVFHVKAAGLRLARPYFAAKTNANFPGNPARFGLPAIQGLIALFDAENGVPLALMDSIEITIRRTGAATAVAARHLARADSAVALICGCGNQGRIQLESLVAVLPIERALAYDVVPGRASRFAGELSARLGIEVQAVTDLGRSRECDVCVTCTPSREPLLLAGSLKPGAFLAAVGADGPDKQEIDPRLLASSALVVDLLEQCAAFGELHHALEAGVMTRDQVRAELGEIVAGRPGRENLEEIIVFDSTGTALQDVAAAALVYEKAGVAGIGRDWDVAC
jgi:alanine dehydrogenase